MIVLFASSVKIEVKNLFKSFAGAPVLKDLSFATEAGKTMSVLGRSGAGKTTLLKIMAGLTTADAGGIWMNGQAIDDLAPQERNIVYLYQEPLLFPHLSVFENVAFGLRIRKLPEQEIRRKTNEMLEHLELEPHARKKSNALSGGQRQRVAFGRALIVNPEVLLLDEPFGNLDAETRSGMQQLFKKIAGEYHITALFVTHDLKEAVLMGDSYALMANGNMQVYSDMHSFVQDPATGFQAEIDFWKSLKS